MENRRNLLIFWLFSSIPAIVWAAVTVNSFTCAFNKDLTANGNCQLFTTKSGTTYVSVGVTYLSPTDNVWTHIKFLRKVKETQKIFGAEFSQNICDHSQGESLNYFIKRMVTMGNKQVKNLKCPLMGNITLSRYRFSLSMVQGFMPPADYVLNFNMEGTKKRLHLLDGNITFSVTAVV